MSNDETVYAVAFWPSEIDGDLGVLCDPWVVLSTESRDVTVQRIRQLFAQYTQLCIQTDEAPENSPLYGFTSWLENTHGYEIVCVVGSTALDCGPLYNLEDNDDNA